VGCAVLAAALAWWVGASAEDTKPAKDLPPELARVPRNVMMVMSFRTREIWEHDVGKGLRKALKEETAEAIKEIDRVIGLSPGDVERVTLALLDPGQSPPIVFVTTAKPYDQKKVIKALAPEGKTETIHGQKVYVSREAAVWLMDPKTLVISGQVQMKEVLGKQEKKKPTAIDDALAVATRHTAVLGVNVPELKRNIPGELPRQVDAFKPLLEARSLLLTADLDREAKAKAALKATFPDEKTARAGEKSAAALHKLALGVLEGGAKQLSKDKEMAGLVALLKKLQASLNAAKPKRDGTVLAAQATIEIDPKTVGEITLSAVQRIREASARIRDANNLKQIALAFHNYHDTNGAFPQAALYDKDGKATLSWRVLILPYIEQDNLYQQFKLDEPWDSKHNKKLLAKIPPVYKHATAKASNPYGTFYQVAVGKGTIFEGKRGIRIQEITDGTSNTILVATAAKDVPWSKPEDMPFGAQVLPQLGKQFRNGTNVAFADGSVRMLSPTIKKETLRALFTRNGGEVIPEDF
jgi:prepilin-type processing-associated H-X9-DG protein